jgi:hypothetical protein
MSKKAGYFSIVISLAMASMFIASSSHAATIGQKRCMMLDKQLSDLVHAAKTPPSKSVSSLADKAKSLCAKGKTSQGLRDYAKALKSLGSQPILPAEQQPNKG